MARPDTWLPHRTGRLRIGPARLAGDTEHDLAELLACFETLVRCGSFGERQHLVDDRNGTTRLDELVDGFEVPRRAHRRTEDRQLLPPDAMEIRRRVRSGRGAADADTPRRPRRVECALPRRLADVIDHDVCAASGEVLHLGDDVVGVMVERAVRAELAGSLQLLGARRG